MRQKREQAKKGRVILHIDMNAFYCSVHEAEEPEKYRGVPCAVSGNVELRKGIIVTSSYPARKKGVKTGMLVSEALKLCPELKLIAPDFELYRRYSRRFLEIVRSYTPLVETFSIDECYADITGSGAFGTPLEIAGKKTIQSHIRSDAGCMFDRRRTEQLFAKMASDMKKPNGLTVLRKRDIPRLLWHRPCDDLYGIGAKRRQSWKNRESARSESCSCG